MKPAPDVTISEACQEFCTCQGEAAGGGGGWGGGGGGGEFHKLGLLHNSYSNDFVF